MVQMKIIILGGFLGSGKTTVLMQFGKYLLRRAQREMKSPSEAPVVILENEISEAGVDNQLLSSANFTVQNIFAGCICCTSTVSLCESVKQIENTWNPEYLLIEATGMAYPDNIRDVLQKEAGKQAVILALADAKRWKRVVRAMQQFVVSHLKDADVILVNKKDLVSEEELKTVQEEAAGYNPGAKIIPVCALEDHADAFWDEVLQVLKFELSET